MDQDVTLGLRRRLTHALDRMDLSQIIGWLKLPQRVLWALLVVCGMILWGPTWFISGLGLETFIATYRMYIGVVFLLFLAATLPTPIQWAASLALVKWRVRRLKYGHTND